MPDSRRQEPTDLYDLLEVSPRASQDVIQAAYRALARAYHPDLNATSDADSRIRQLNDAYGVLSDPLSRARYDLDRTRARRHEWVVNQEHSAAGMGPSRHQHGRLQVLRPPATVRRPSDDRVFMLNGQVLLGLILVAALALLAFVLIWATLDVPPDSVFVSHTRVAEFTGR